MPEDTKKFAVGVAFVALTGAVVAVVGLAVLATQHVGVWLGVVVVGAAASLIGTVALFALGTVEDERESQSWRGR